jgi:hypothetical protein
MIGARHLWLLFAIGDAGALIFLSVWADLSFLQVLAPLSFSFWAFVDRLPEGRAWLERLHNEYRPAGGFFE